MKDDKAKTWLMIRHKIGWTCFLLALGLTLWVVWSVVRWMVMRIGEMWLAIPIEVRTQMFTPVFQGLGLLVAIMVLLAVANALIEGPSDTGKGE